MATRTFTVFQDTPSSSDSTSRAASKPVRASSRILSRSASTSKSNLPAASENAVAIDKENLNPLTGLRASTTALNGEKKRKTTVLATKAHATTVGKKALKPQASIVAEPDTKKRKTATGALKSKPATTSKKESSVLKPTASSARKSKRTSPSSRKPPVLPKVVEETTTGISDSVIQVQELSQAAIDSRCYDLTVTPLADVSEAYEASVFSGKTLRKSDESLFRIVKEASAEPELRDYFTLDTFTTLASSRRTLISEEPEEKKSTATTFSTPERAKLYASFTFSSPSPSSKRFRDVYGSRPDSPTRSGTRATSVFSFEDDGAFMVLHS
ncbi:hypothetical protein D9611_011974 [Ephemerocybe angulata]|uniref:Uncharacterized protein n=1 Tax=Ephemerocybe angulata TaxID=980116 RepID=A0A8H5C3N2_9AGAR|nr:hypothetical protein D9611_011974 [Tulosesus angulatus]